MSSRLFVTGVAGTLALGLLAAPAAAEPAPVRFLGATTVPNALPFDGTTVGGLSGIDYDRRTGEYVLICDDRSALQPARFYTARFDVTAGGLGPVTFTDTEPLRRPDGSTYPKQGVDPEDLRVDPWTGRYYWVQEGERAGGTLADPSLRVATRDGGYAGELPIPDNERMTEGAGPRQNLALEGLTFAAAGSLLVSSVEGPLLQDGPEATPEHGSLSRITVQSRFGPVLAQYAYPQEPVFASPNPPGAFATTGVSSILAADPLDPTRFLVLERSFVTGVGNKVRLFEVDTKGATNVMDVPSLGNAKKLKPVRKRLLADLAAIPGSTLSTVDNVEGMTLGPRLPSGERSLLLVSDDNFAATQVTQLIALALP
ncbi:esterase-like activity of phytase family protein [Amycolatopsis nigrescens]|uniref:esterase-like activity of phytase family protein n=1 Tax=Amycolatopsis nigrescens TaxID=381445 RepID=UPI000477A427|nr:esterase-like activity of phytase family protein [Amycolatopsis nigrescens]